MEPFRKRIFKPDLEDDALSPSKCEVKLEAGVELNSRGIPARKRKKNSLIFGDDDLVSLPVRSPRKKTTLKTAAPAHHGSARQDRSHKTETKEVGGPDV